MLTLQQIKENPEQIVARLAVKGFDGKEAIDRIIALDESRRQLQLKNDSAAAELKKLAASIGALMKAGQKEEADKAKETVATLKESQKAIADELAATENTITEILLSVPTEQCEMLPERRTSL